MLRKKIIIISLIALACILSLFANDIFGAEFKKSCLLRFMTAPGEMNPLSNEKSRIVYFSQPGGVGNESNIFSIRPDGTDTIQHTNANDGLPYKFDPAWSPDGTMLVFDAHSDTVGKDIIISSVTSELTYPNNFITTLDAGCDEYYASFSPDNEKIVAVRDCGEGTNDIVIFNLADGTWTSLGHFDLTMISAPKYSPDGTKIVFFAYDTEWPIVTTNDIYLIDSDGTNLLNLTNTETVSERDPCWSPDGQYIVYGSKPDSSDYSELHIMESDGTYIQALTSINFSETYSPSFSPDGEMIVFSIYDSVDYYGMYIINIYEGGYAFLLNEDKIYLTDTPVWSLEFDPPSVNEFKAYPRYLEAGSSTVLLWRTRHTYSCKIENDIGEDVGSVDLNGNISVTPASTTTYTIKAYGLAGSVATQKIKVIVE